MTDHLEPYRRMARSIRFFPPLSLKQPSQEAVAQVVTPALGVDSSPRKTQPENHVQPDLGPPVDPSEHAAALVHEAVSKRTVLPTTYTILENIGDRISRLTSPKPVESLIIQPKIPQPDPNWTPAHTIEPQVIEAEPQAIEAEPQVIEAEPQVIEAEPQAIEAEPQVIEAEPQVIEAEPQVIEAESQAIEAESQVIEAEPKKLIDDAQPEASTSERVVTEAPPVEDTSNDEPVAAVVEPVAVEETPDEQVSAAVVVEPVEAEETSDEPVAVVAEPVEAEETVEVEEATNEQEVVAAVAESVEVEETRNDTADNNTLRNVNETTPVTEITSEHTPATDTPVADAEDDQTPTLLERVSSLVEAVSTAFKNPEVEQKDSETVEEPSPSDSIATEVPAADAVESLTTDAQADEAEDAQAPSLLDRVSSALEAVSTAFNNPEAEQKDSETVEEPSPSDSIATEVPVTDAVEPLTTDAQGDETESAQAPSLLDRVSSAVEAVVTSFKDSDAGKTKSEAAVEPAPAAEEKDLNNKTVEITCPKCESTDLRKNGRRQGKQRYVCKDCGRQFVIPDSAEGEELPKVKSSSPIETSKVKGSQLDTSVSDSSSKSSKGQSKKKTKAKGFGGSKAK